MIPPMIRHRFVKGCNYCFTIIMLWAIKDIIESYFILFSLQMLVWRAVGKMWGISCAMSGRATAEAILCAIIKWHFLALRTVESWPIIIMWKIILNPPGQSPQTAGRVYPETKKSYWKMLSLVPLFWMQTKVLKVKEKPPKTQKVKGSYVSSLISSPFLLSKSKFLFGDWHLGRVFATQTFPDSWRW